MTGRRWAEELAAFFYVRARRPPEILLRDNACGYQEFFYPQPGGFSPVCPASSGFQVQLLNNQSITIVRQIRVFGYHAT